MSQLSLIETWRESLIRSYHITKGEDDIDTRNYSILGSYPHFKLTQPAASHRYTPYNKGPLTPLAAVLYQFQPHLSPFFFSMALPLKPLFFFSFVSLVSGSYSLLLPVTKDAATLQYVTQIHHGTPLVPIKLVLDLGAPFLWLDCSSGHVSSSNTPILCGSIQCLTAKTSDSGHGGGTSTCRLSPKNTITGLAEAGELAEDMVAVEGSEMGSRFLFSCAPKPLLKGLASGTVGMLGLGRTRIALPSQLAASDPNSEGYFISVKSIRINGRGVSLGTITGGTRLSTVVPYTTMKRSVYDIFTKAYIKAAASMNITRVESMAPFGVCFRSESSEPAVPTIDLVLQSEMVKWRILGRNSMVRVSDKVMCLGFLDGVYFFFFVHIKRHHQSNDTISISYVILFAP
ncbi:unnamed protein product, partial [Vitis vinifera]